MKIYQKPEMVAYQLRPERGFSYSDAPENMPGADDDSSLNYGNGGDAWW